MTPYVEAGSLSLQCWRRYSNKYCYTRRLHRRVGLLQKLRWWTDILEGLSILHRQGLLHGALNSQCVLCTYFETPVRIVGASSRRIFGWTKRTRGSSASSDASLQTLQLRQASTGDFSPLPQGGLGLTPSSPFDMARSHGGGISLLEQFKRVENAGKSDGNRALLSGMSTTDTTLDGEELCANDHVGAKPAMSESGPLDRSSCGSNAGGVVLLS